MDTSVTVLLVLVVITHYVQKWRVTNEQCVVIHTYIYQVRPIRVRLLVRTPLQNSPLILVVGVIIQVLPGEWYLYYHSAFLELVNCAMF